MAENRFVPQWHDEFEAHLDRTLDLLGVERSLPKPPDSVTCRRAVQECRDPRQREYLRARIGGSLPPETG